MRGIDKAFVVIALVCFCSVFFGLLLGFETYQMVSTGQEVQGMIEKIDYNQEIGRYEVTVSYDIKGVEYENVINTHISTMEEGKAFPLICNLENPNNVDVVHLFPIFYLVSFGSLLFTAWCLFYSKSKKMGQY